MHQKKSKESSYENFHVIRLLAIWKNIANNTYHGDSQIVVMLPKGKTFSNSSFCTFGPNMTTGFIINSPVINFKVHPHFELI